MFASNKINILLMTLLILSHVLSDFYFQSDQLSNDKKKSIKKLIFHGFIFFITSMLLTVPFIHKNLGAVMLVLSLVHIIVDYIKICLEKKYKNTLILFIADQLVHITFIFASYPFLKNIVLNVSFKNLLSEILIAYPFLNVVHSDKISYYIIVITLYLFVINGAGVMVGLITQKYSPFGILIYKQQIEGKMMQETFEQIARSIQTEGSISYEPKNTGKVIGIFERLIIFTLVICQQYTAITFVIAAKSIARYKDLEKQISSEYYLIGTLSSVFLAIICGAIANKLKILF